jgi:hypothetical protein
MSDPESHPTDAEMAQPAAMLEERGLIEVYVDEEGREAYRLTVEGVRVGNMLAMVRGEDADAVLEALLDGPSIGSLQVDTIAPPCVHRRTPAWSIRGITGSSTERGSREVPMRCTSLRTHGLDEDP